MIKTNYLTEQTLNKILDRLSDITVCTIGDMCLDYYLYADMKLSSLSRETPHYPLPVVKEVISPGGGGNVVNNIGALKVKKLLPVSLVGNDWRGVILKNFFKENGFETKYILTSDSFTTTCYCKPMRMGISDIIYEDPRLDFENREPLNKENEERIINALNEAVKKADILVVSDQMKNGIITPKVRQAVSFIAEEIPVVVDSRENAGLYKNVIIKPNEVEAAYMAGKDITGLDLSVEQLSQIGIKLSNGNHRPVIVTMGEKGALWCDKGKASLAPTVKAEDPVDFVGAGDTFLAAFCCAFATGAKGEDAAAFANLASGVTVKKIGTTGTASKAEIAVKFAENIKKW